MEKGIFRTIDIPDLSRSLARRPILGLFSFFFTLQAFAKVGHRSQAAAWAGLSIQTKTVLSGGLHWIPQVNWTSALGQNLRLGAEASVHAFGSDGVGTRSHGSWDINPYRLWARLSSDQWEVRLGLQQINFGSAFLLRPLMWFDRLDPHDPLQLTEAVYAGLIRHVFSNNATLWGWILWGNTKPKGWETFGTRKEVPEWGGRIQIPLPRGELGLSLHHREGLFSSPMEGKGGEESRLVPETKGGIDGKWDIGPGVWFEATVVKTETHGIPSQKSWALGADYTFGIGNGLHLLGETFGITFARDLWGRGKTTRLSALWADYPVTLLDRVNGMFLWDWTHRAAYRLMTWQRTYDRWSFYGMAFWNPKRPFWPNASLSRTFWFGKGIQIITLWHF